MIPMGEELQILLVAPDLSRHFNYEKDSIAGIYPNLGLNYLKTTMMKERKNVRVVDTLITFASSNFKSPINVTTQAEKWLTKDNVNILGISVLTPFRKKAIEIARFAKTVNPKIRIILGGPHVTIIGEPILERYKNLVDVIVIGEGEETLPEIIDAFEGKIDLQEVHGIAYSNSDGEIIKTLPRPEKLDLDTIPFPDYDQYKEVLPNHKLPTAAVLTSRGCPYKCGFCSCPFLWKHRRVRSPENVVREIEYLLSEYGVEEIRIWDDTFGFNKDQAVGICKLLVENHIKVRIGYLNSSFGVIDEEILFWYKRACGTGIFYGLESGSEKVREYMGKHFTNDTVREVVKATKKVGLRFGLFLIFGYPGETAADVKETYKLVEELQPDQVICNLPNIYPGTMLFKQAVEEGKVDFKDWLEEEPEYFPYLDSEEIKGYVACFEQTFNRKPLIRTEFENIIYDYFSGSRSYLERVRDKARKKLVRIGAIKDEK